MSRWSSTQSGNESQSSDARQETISHSLCGDEAREARDLQGREPPDWRISNMLSVGSFVPIIASFDLGFIRTAPTNSASFTHCFNTNSY